MLNNLKTLAIASGNVEPYFKDPLLSYPPPPSHSWIIPQLGLSRATNDIMWLLLKILISYTYNSASRWFILCHSKLFSYFLSQSHKFWHAGGQKFQKLLQNCCPAKSAVVSSESLGIIQLRPAQNTHLSKSIMSTSTRIWTKIHMNIQNALIYENNSLIKNHVGGWQETGRVALQWPAVVIIHSFICSFICSFIHIP